MTSNKEEREDIAGKDYWNTQWASIALPTSLWNIDSKHFRDSVERKLFAHMRDCFERHLGPTKGKRLLEIGCAHSCVLPLFYLKSGFEIYGIDYSDLGCSQTRMILLREHVPGIVICCDLFNPPEQFVGHFDAVLSLGVVEHFTDTQAVVTAMAKLLRPGGVLFTHIPNMTGLTGLAQRLLDRSTFEKHMQIEIGELHLAHVSSGLDVVSCNYFMSINLGVANIGGIPRSTLEWTLKRGALTWLARVTNLVWLTEQYFGEFPVSRLFSPYINCVAIKPAINV